MLISVSQNSNICQSLFGKIVVYTNFFVLQNSNIYIVYANIYNSNIYIVYANFCFTK